MPRAHLILDDCAEALVALPNDSIDSLVTDPPAGIGFMGKDWDKDKGGRKEWCAWMEGIMRECLRVMKPGAHGLVWALPRTSHWTATALEDAGFEIRDCVYHVFGSGFPKSLDVSKAIDKAVGVKRKIVGHQNYSAPDIRGNSYDQSHVSERERLGVPITEAATDAAKQWQGWGTALKPAVECWWLIRKPISEKTVAANVLKWGTGGLNIDASRVVSPDIQGKTRDHNGKVYDGVAEGYQRPNKSSYTHKTNWEAVPGGRFPANLVLSHSPHCEDTQCDIECAVAMLDAQSPFNKESRTKSPAGVTSNGNGSTHGAMKRIESVNHPGQGHASRFFYCAKVSPSERNAGLEAKANVHPTVKPQKLMRYLCKLITPPGGVVLDPFMGSGSTGLAAKTEGFGFVGIEREQEYFQIAQARIGLEDKAG